MCSQVLEESAFSLSPPLLQMVKSENVFCPVELVKGKAPFSLPCLSSQGSESSLPEATWGVRAGAQGGPSFPRRPPRRAPGVLQVLRVNCQGTSQGHGMFQNPGGTHSILLPLLCLLF